MVSSQPQTLAKLRDVERTLLELAENDSLHVKCNSLRALSAVRQMIYGMGEFPVGILADAGAFDET
ncbi:MAG: hypothetical protein HY675_02690 [Chloroflexi bacterium]|nr:hypothetical protein [Chloroflexota bacterium]